MPFSSLLAFGEQGIYFTDCFLSKGPETLLSFGAKAGGLASVSFGAGATFSSCF